MTVLPEALVRIQAEIACAQIEAMAMYTENMRRRRRTENMMPIDIVGSGTERIDKNASFWRINDANVLGCIILDSRII